MIKLFFRFFKTWQPLLWIALISSSAVAVVSWGFEPPFAATEFINTLFRNFVAVLIAQIATYRNDLLGQKRLKKHMIYLAYQVRQNLEPSLYKKVSPIEAARLRSELVTDTLKKDITEMRQMGLTLGAANAIPDNVVNALDQLYQKVLNQGNLNECAEYLQIIIEHFKF